MVDHDSGVQRLARLGALIEALERTHARGAASYSADEDARAATERRLQLAEQICIDLGAQLLSETGSRPARDYADVFTSLAETGQLDHELAVRLGQMARQRNLLVHAYLDVEDAQVFDSLAHLGDLRAFAAVIQRRLDADG